MEIMASPAITSILIKSGVFSHWLKRVFGSKMNSKLFSFIYVIWIWKFYDQNECYFLRSTYVVSVYNLWID